MHVRRFNHRMVNLSVKAQGYLLSGRAFEIIEF